MNTGNGNVAEKRESMKEVIDLSGSEPSVSQYFSPRATVTAEFVQFGDG